VGYLKKEIQGEYDPFVPPSSMNESRGKLLPKLLQEKKGTLEKIFDGCIFI